MHKDKKAVEADPEFTSKRDELVKKMQEFDALIPHEKWDTLSVVEREENRAAFKQLSRVISAQLDKWATEYPGVTIRLAENYVFQVTDIVEEIPDADIPTVPRLPQKRGSARPPTLGETTNRSQANPTNSGSRVWSTVQPPSSSDVAGRRVLATPVHGSNLCGVETTGLSGSPAALGISISYDSNPATVVAGTIQVSPESPIQPNKKKA